VSLGTARQGAIDFNRSEACPLFFPPDAWRACDFTKIRRIHV
jgi:hypothetical protein